MSNVSYGANRRFAKECVQALTEVGFTIDTQNSDPLPQNLSERFFK